MEITGKRYFEVDNDLFEIQIFVKNEKETIGLEDFHFYDKWKMQRFIDVNIPPYTHANFESVIYLPNENQFVVRATSKLQIDEFDDEKKRFAESEFTPDGIDFTDETSGTENPLLSKTMKMDGDFILASVEVKSFDNWLCESQFQYKDVAAKCYFSIHSPIIVKKVNEVSYNTKNHSFIYTAKFPKRKMKNFKNTGFVEVE